MLKTSNFLIGFLNYENNKEGEYIEKYFSHTYNSKVNPEQLENYLIKKYGKIIADENNINIDCLCVSKFIKL